MADDPEAQVMRIVIAGGGVAGLEAALALSDLAAGRVEIDLISSQSTFADLPMSVLEAFGQARAERFALGEILAGQPINHRVDTVTWIDRIEREAHTRSHTAIEYDGLLLCPGARAQPAYPHAITISGAPGDPALAGVIADVDVGAAHRIAFIVPAPGSWQLPLYELALLTAARARERHLDVWLSIFIPERLPMEAFGGQVGSAARRLLADAGIELVPRAVCRVPDPHSVLVDIADTRDWPQPRPRRRERPLTFDRIVALPRLRGPRLRGVPAVHGGFIPVDLHGRILGAQVEFAAGDATNCPVKHGSVAAQQADAAAAMLAALAGAHVHPAPFHPVARGVLLTGAENRQVSASIVGGHSIRSEVASTGATAADKLDARYLSPRLDALRTARTPR
jgi:sulfide:quinone oxidoreductase